MKKYINPFFPLFFNPDKTTQRAKIILAAFFLFACPFFLSDGFARTIRINADELLEYAKTCEQRGDLEECAAAYGRFLHFFTDDPRCDEIRYQRAVILDKAGQRKAAVSELEKLAAQTGNLEIRDESLLKQAEIYEKAGKLGESELVLLNLMAVTQNPEIRSRALYHTGWLSFQSGKWRAAEDLFMQMDPKDRIDYEIPGVIKELNTTQKALRKNPRTAGLLSVIPGAGYLYLGRYRDAVFAFALNAGLALAAVEAFDRDMPVLGGLFGVGFAGFYSGNIYGSAAAAHRHNKNLDRQFIQKMRKGLILDFSSGEKDWRVAAGWGWNF